MWVNDRLERLDARLETADDERRRHRTLVGVARSPHRLLGGESNRSRVVGWMIGLAVTGIGLALVAVWLWNVAALVQPRR